MTPGDPPSDFGIHEALARLAERRDLTSEESGALVHAILAGEATDAQIGAVLLAWRVKGETVDELVGATRTMRRWATPVVTSRYPLLDTCGTGGDGRGSANVSTAVAFVAAGAGVAVAKHGNRSLSSRSGSADVLEAAGIRLDLDAAQMGVCLDEVGVAFLFAPSLHPAMRHAAGPRRELKLRTLFNLLGPLTNPAGAHRQLLGVFDAEHARLLARALHLLGTERTWVVHGGDGLDELSIATESLVFDVTPRGVRRRTLAPERAGITRCPSGAPPGGDPGENARWLMALLGGEVRDASHDLILWNSAAALVVAGVARDLREGRERALESLASGAALGALNRLRDLGRRL